MQSSLPQNIIDESAEAETSVDASAKATGREADASAAEPVAADPVLAEEPCWSQQQPPPSADEPAESSSPQQQATTQDGLDAPRKEPAQWFDVGMIKCTSCLITNFIFPSKTPLEDQFGSEYGVGLHAGQVGFLRKAELDSGTAYKFRVAGINACGRGVCSEVTAFKTCLPGYPGALSAIKITKGADRAHLTWEPPQNCAGRITDYSVNLAVRYTLGGDGQLPFVPVYVGAEPQCIVSTANLHAAHVDTTTKPAIIFRVAARNDKGYGPATQVRWLQDQMPGAALPQPPPPSVVRATRPVHDDRQYAQKGGRMDGV